MEVLTWAQMEYLGHIEFNIVKGSPNILHVQEWNRQPQNMKQTKKTNMSQIKFFEERLYITTTTCNGKLVVYSVDPRALG